MLGWVEMLRAVHRRCSRCSKLTAQWRSPCCTSSNRTSTASLRKASSRGRRTTCQVQCLPWVSAEAALSATFLSSVYPNKNRSENGQVFVFDAAYKRQIEQDWTVFCRQQRGHVLSTRDAGRPAAAAVTVHPHTAHDPHWTANLRQGLPAA